MELIRISDSKLKVMLSAEDMTRYELNCDSIEREDSSSRRAFWSILQEAKRQTGFDPAGERMFVQLYPEKSGGCEMFVTKLGIRTRDAVLPTEEKSPVSLRESVYRFDAMGDLLAACRRIRDAASVTVSRAYVDETRRRFYLTTDREVPYLAEYNAAEGGMKDLHYIAEHCRCFCRDAAASLGALA